MSTGTITTTSPCSLQRIKKEDAHITALSSQNSKLTIKGLITNRLSIFYSFIYFHKDNNPQGRSKIGPHLKAMPKTDRSLPTATIVRSSVRPGGLRLPHATLRQPVINRREVADTGDVRKQWGLYTTQPRPFSQSSRLAYIWQRPVTNQADYP